MIFWDKMRLSELLGTVMCIIIVHDQNYAYMFHQLLPVGLGLDLGFKCVFACCGLFCFRIMFYVSCFSCAKA